MLWGLELKLTFGELPVLEVAYVVSTELEFLVAELPGVRVDDVVIESKAGIPSC